MLSIFLSFILLSSAPAIADDHFFAWEFNCSSIKYTSNSNFATNLNSTLQILTDNSTSTHYASVTVGDSPDQVFGLYLCRFDTNDTSCQTCLNVANQGFHSNCSLSTSGAVFYDYCNVYYGQSALSLTDNSIQDLLNNPNNATDPDAFNQVVLKLMNATADYAVNSNSENLYGTGVMNGFAAYPEIYSYVQCTPDMGGKACRECLQDLFDQITENGLRFFKGGRVLGMRCSMEYETNVFFDGNPAVQLIANQSPSPFTPTTTPTAPPLPTGKKHTVTIVLATTIPAAALLVIATAIYIICFRRKKSITKFPDEEPVRDEVARAESILYNLSAIRTATNNFAYENKLGQGGFGVVYKGLLPDGSAIAVKKLLTSSNQGFGQLKNELVLVAKLQHRNLVRLLGVCWDVEKLLVYEYVPNGSLEKFIFDRSRRQELHWGTRFKIICGIARGLQYLHEESQLKVIHRDLKASNILLDEDMNPKISDFGLAKLFRNDQSYENTHQVVGTFGYMAPEYVTQGLYSSKSDVYSFGILVLEIATGRKNGSSGDSENSENAQGLLGYIWEKWSRGTSIDLIDPTVADNCLTNEVLKCIHIALLCVQENPTERPNMSAVNVMLNSSTITLQLPSRPPFVYGMSTIFSAMNSSGTNDMESNKLIEDEQNKMSLSEVEAR